MASSLQTHHKSSTGKLSAWVETLPALGISPMDHLYNRLDGMYMGKWRKDFPSETSIENWRMAWAEAFSEEGITFEEVRVGIAACRRQYDWAPSLPEFLKACRPSLDFEIAFLEAVAQMHKRRNPVRVGAELIDGEVVGGELVSNDRWSHPAIYWAAVSLGGDLGAIPYQQFKTRWKNALENALKTPDREVPVYRQALPAPGKASISTEEARARLEEVRAVLGKAKRVVVPPRLSDRQIEERRNRMVAEAELLAAKKGEPQ